MQAHLTIGKEIEKESKRLIVFSEVEKNQFSNDETIKAIEVFQILIRWRDEARIKGIIDW